MLPALHRLSRDKEILAVIKGGKRIKTPHVFLYVLDRGDDKETRVACVAGKKVDPKAVARHLQQRRLREAARKKLPDLKNGLDMVWVALSSIKTAEDAQLEKDVSLALAPYTKR